MPCDEAMGGILQFESVGLRHGPAAEILSNIELRLGRGDLAVVTGGAGCGKSQLAALAAGVLAPSRGAVRLFGQDGWRDPAARNRRIGYVGADLPLIEGMTLARNVELPLRIAGENSEERIVRVAELLDWLGLRARGIAPIAHCSLAERERAQVARAVIARPELLIADEAAALAEPRVVQLIERLLDLGAAALVLTRDVGLAETLPATQRYRLAQGRLIALPTGRAS